VISECETAFFDIRQSKTNSEAEDILSQTAERLLQRSEVREQISYHDIYETVREALYSIRAENKMSARTRLQLFLRRRLVNNKTYDFYYLLNNVSGFPNHFKLGHGELIQFSSLPSFISQRIVRALKGQTLGYYLKRNESRKYVERGKRRSCLRLRETRQGFFKSLEIANKHAYESANVLRVVSGVDVPLYTLVHYRVGSHWDIGSLSYGGGGFGDVASLGSVGMMPPFHYQPMTWPSLIGSPTEPKYSPLGTDDTTFGVIFGVRYHSSFDTPVEQCTKLLLKSNPSELDGRLKNALRVLGFTWEVHLDELKLILLITAIETMLLEESSQENLQSRLADRVAFLLESQPDKRVRMFHEVKNYYQMRSRFIHGAQVLEAEGSLNLERLFEITIRIWIRLNRLTEEGYTRVGRRDSAKSLDELVEELKFA
jgi:hypothetical protein